MPDARRAEALNDLVCFTIEDCDLKPDKVRNIAIREPLRTWMAARGVMG